MTYVYTYSEYTECAYRRIQRVPNSTKDTCYCEWNTKHKTVYPCYNIALKGIELAPSVNASAQTQAVGTCAYVASGGVGGLSGSGC